MPSISVLVSASNSTVAKNLNIVAELTCLIIPDYIFIKSQIPKVQEY